MSIIVVVEDDADIRDLIVMWLERAGHQVEAARNGREGVDVCLELLPDLVVMDVMMPVMSGLDAVVALRSEPRLAHTAVVMLSAGGLSTDREAGLAAGADTYVTKPFALGHLLEVVTSLLHSTPPSPPPPS